MSKSIEAESSKQIKQGVIISYIAIIINIIAGLLYTPWMIKEIGQSDFGLYTLAVSLISMFLIDFGLGMAVSRFLSLYIAQGNQEKANKILSIAYKIYLVIDGIIFIVLILVFFNLNTIFHELTNQELEKFKVVFAIAALFSFISFPFLTLNGVLTAYERFFKLKFYDLLNKVISITLIIIALLNGFGLYALVLSNAFSGLLIIIFKYKTVKKETPIKVDFKYKDKDIKKQIFSFSIWSAIVGIAQRFIFNITPSIIGMVSGAKNIAVFGVAMAIEGYVFTIANAINGLFLPKVSRIVMDNKNGSSRILGLMIKIGRIQLYIIGIIVIGFILLGRDFVLLWVGEKYYLAYYSVILLILPSIVYLPQQIGNTAVIAYNKVKLQAKVFLIMALINIVLSLVLSAKYGVIGASLSIFIAYTFRNIGMNFIYHKILKINIFTFFKECHLKIIPPLIVIMIFNYYIFKLFITIGWLNLIFKGLILVITYFISLWLFIFNDEEKKILKKLIYSRSLRRL